MKSLFHKSRKTVVHLVGYSIVELNTDITVRLEKIKSLEQGSQARNLLVDKLIADLKVAVPAKMIL